MSLRLKENVIRNLKDPANVFRECLLSEKEPQRSPLTKITFNCQSNLVEYV